jgi:hypothetical protein
MVSSWERSRGSATTTKASRYCDPCSGDSRTGLLLEVGTPCVKNTYMKNRRLCQTADLARFSGFPPFFFNRRFDVKVTARERARMLPCDFALCLCC